MTYRHAVLRLTTTYADLQEAQKKAKGHADNEHYRLASDEIAEAIGTAQRQLLVAKDEIDLPSVDAQVDNTRDDVLELTKNIEFLIRNMEVEKQSIDQLYSTNAFEKKANKVDEKIAKRQQKLFVEQCYLHRYNALVSLLTQKRPMEGVSGELTAFLQKVKEARTNKTIKTTELNEAMDAAYSLLIGKSSKEEFDFYTQKLEKKHSVALKVLGATLFLLGAAFTASAILFAPAIITSSSVSLATVYGATAAETLVSAALFGAGTASFFKSTDRMKTADAMKKLGDRAEVTPVPAYAAPTAS